MADVVSDVGEKIVHSLSYASKELLDSLTIYPFRIDDLFLTITPVVDRYTIERNSDTSRSCCISHKQSSL